MMLWQTVMTLGLFFTVAITTKSIYHTTGWVGGFPMSKQRAKGTAFETGFVRFARAVLGDERIHRAALSGSRDQGDVHGLFAHGYEGIVECKNVKSVNRALLEDFKRQTLNERDNADADFSILVVHEPGCDATGKKPSFGDNSAYMTVWDLFRIFPKAAIKCVESTPTDFGVSQVLDMWVRVSVIDALTMIGGVYEDE